jgi:hypothetical protein
MADTQAELEARLAAIDAAIARPEGYVMFADRAVTYRSIADLQKARDAIARQLATVTSASRPKQTLIVATKGLL